MVPARVNDCFSGGGIGTADAPWGVFGPGDCPVDGALPGDDDLPDRRGSGPPARAIECNWRTATSATPIRSRRITGSLKTLCGKQFRIPVVFLAPLQIEA